MVCLIIKIEDNDLENILKRIEENFSDMEDVCVDNCNSEIIPLFRVYTDEIISIIKGEIRIGD